MVDMNYEKAIKKIVFVVYRCGWDIHLLVMKSFQEISQYIFEECLSTDQLNADQLIDSIWFWPALFIFHSFKWIMTTDTFCRILFKNNKFLIILDALTLAPLTIIFSLHPFRLSSNCNLFCITHTMPKGYLSVIPLSVWYVFMCVSTAGKLFNW